MGSSDLHPARNASADRSRSATGKAAATDCLPTLSVSSVISPGLFLLRLLRGGLLFRLLNGGLLLASMRRCFDIDFLEPFDQGFGHAQKRLPAGWRQGGNPDLRRFP